MADLKKQHGRNWTVRRPWVMAPIPWLGKWFLAPIPWLGKRFLGLSQRWWAILSSKISPRWNSLRTYLWSWRCHWMWGRFGRVVNVFHCERSKPRYVIFKLKPVTLCMTKMCWKIALGVCDLDERITGRLYAVVATSKQPLQFQVNFGQKDFVFKGVA